MIIPLYYLTFIHMKGFFNIYKVAISSYDGLKLMTNQTITTDPLDKALNKLFDGIHALLNECGSEIGKAIDSDRDEFNEVFDQLEEKKTQYREAYNRCVVLTGKVKTLEDKLIHDRADTDQIISLAQKVRVKAEETEKELKALKALNPQKIQKQWKVTKAKNIELADRNKALETQSKSLKTEANRLANKFTDIANKHNGLIDLCSTMRHVMYQEGAVLHTSISGEVTNFYLYKRPALTKKSIKIHSATDKVADKPYFFRVETDLGIHFDVYPLEGDQVGYSGDIPFAIPSEVGDHCKEEFKKVGTAESSNYDDFIIEPKTDGGILDIIDQLGSVLDRRLKG